MLEFMRNKTRSLAVYAVLGVIILTFIISFGPAANKLSCGGENVIAKVDEREVTLLDWQYSRALAGTLLRDSEGVVLVRFAMDKIIERKMLSNLARKNGIRFSVADAEEMILQNRVIVFGQEVPLTVFGAWPVDPKTQKPGEFNYQRFRNWVSHFLGIPDETRFLKIQVEEMEAKAYKDAFLFGLAGSSRMRWMNYQNEYLEITFKAARIAPEAFLESVEISEEDITAELETEEGKKAAQETRAADEKRFAEVPKTRHVMKAVVPVEEAFLADVLKQEARDPESLRKAIPAQAWRVNRVMQAVDQIKACVKEDSLCPDTFTTVGEFGASDETLGTELLLKIWEEPLRTVHGPYFTEEGAVLYIAENESGGPVDEETGLRMAARDNLLFRKAAIAAKEFAEKALSEAQAGKSPSEIKGMPEMFTEGPVNPLKGQPGLITQEVAKELWNLETPGKVLPRVITDETGGRTVYKLMFLESRKLPSREDFEAQEAQDSVSTMSSRATHALDLFLYDHCVTLVKAGRVQMEPPIAEALTFKRNPDAKLEDAQDLPPEEYAPCAHVGSGLR